MKNKSEKKGLEEKTGQLLNEQIKNFIFIEKEAEDKFPNFINYLKEEYDFLSIKRIPQAKNPSWVISTKCESKDFVIIGLIGYYIKEKIKTSEYGYKVEIFTKGLLHELKYREGYLCLDTATEQVIYNKDPKRYDKTKDIPFP